MEPIPRKAYLKKVLLFRTSCGPRQRRHSYSSLTLSRSALSVPETRRIRQRRHSYSSLTLSRSALSVPETSRMSSGRKPVRLRSHWLVFLVSTCTRVPSPSFYRGEDNLNYRRQSKNLCILKGPCSWSWILRQLCACLSFLPTLGSFIWLMICADVVAEF